MNISGISLCAVAENTEHRAASKKVNNVESSRESIRSVYSKNGLSSAVVSNYSARISFSGGIKSKDLKKVIKRFEKYDPEIVDLIAPLEHIMSDVSYKNLNKADRKVFSGVFVLDKLIKKHSLNPSELDNELKKVVSDYAKDSRINARIRSFIGCDTFVDDLKKRKSPLVPIDKNDIFDYAILKKYSIKLRRLEDVKLFKQLAKHGFCGEENIEPYLPSFDALEKHVHYINEQGIWAPLSHIPKASKLNTIPIQISSGDEATENVVVNLALDNLQTLGFKNELTKEKFSAIGHAVDKDDFSPWLQDYVAEEGADALLSASYFQKGKFPTFRDREYGVFVDVDPRNIALASSSNMASGFAKDFVDFKNALFSFLRSDRSRFSEALQDGLGVSRKEYSMIYSDLAAKARTLEDIQDSTVRVAVEEAVQKTLVNHKGNISELAVYAPVPKAVFTKNSDLSQMPYKLRKYAQDKDIPIVDISKMD